MIEAKHRIDVLVERVGDYLSKINTFERVELIVEKIEADKLRRFDRLQEKQVQLIYLRT